MDGSNNKPCFYSGLKKKFILFHFLISLFCSVVDFFTIFLIQVGRVSRKITMLIFKMSLLSNFLVNHFFKEEASVEKNTTPSQNRFIIPLPNKLIWYIIYFFSFLYHADSIRWLENKNQFIVSLLNKLILYIVNVFFLS